MVLTTDISDFFLIKLYNALYTINLYSVILYMHLLMASYER